MRKNTIKLVGASMAVLLVATGCGKVPKLENGQAIIQGNGKGEFDWQVPVNLERLMVILDKLGVLEG